MIDPAYARTMAAYNLEMNLRLYAAAGRLSEAERRRDRGAFWGSIHATLAHLYWADRMWMSRFDGWDPPSGNLQQSGMSGGSFSDLAQARIDVDQRLAAWAGGLTEAWLDGDLTWFSAAAQREITAPRAMIVTHLFNHQTHHRGQVHAMLTPLARRPKTPTCRSSCHACDRRTLGGSAEATFHARVDIDVAASPRSRIMSDDLVFYTHPMSRGRIVRWMLEEVGHPYATELLDYNTSMKAPAYLAINPMGKVPAIRHGETVVTECAAICAYLADAFPDAGLAPPSGDKERGVYYRWMFFGAGPVETAALHKSLAFEVPVGKRGFVGYGSMDDVLTALEQAVSRSDYLIGDRFTAADVYLGSQIGWGMQFGTIEKRPAFERYFSRLRDRPAAVRARETDDALLPPEMRRKTPA